MKYCIQNSSWLFDLNRFFFGQKFSLHASKKIYRICPRLIKSFLVSRSDNAIEKCIFWKSRDHFRSVWIVLYSEKQLLVCGVTSVICGLLQAFPAFPLIHLNTLSKFIASHPPQSFTVQTAHFPYCSLARRTFLTEGKFRYSNSNLSEPSATACPLAGISLASR